MILPQIWSAYKRSRKQSYKFLEKKEKRDSEIKQCTIEKKTTLDVRTSRFKYDI